ncbi:MAG: hypothetical protein ACJAZO_002885 [Myxococcota bacterium]|jgi:hypothetical protein
MFDELNINQTASLSATMDVQGDTEFGYALSTPQVDGVSYQWFLDGQAIAGAKDSAYDIPQEMPANGEYSVRIDDGTGCSFTEESEPAVMEDAQGFDQDGDGVEDDLDACPNGDSGGVSSSATDSDSDGCSDDEDVDNDGVSDVDDRCLNGDSDRTSDDETAMDADGCNAAEDDDIDGDGLSNKDEGAADPDQDDIPNHNDADSDDDGRDDAYEVRSDIHADPYRWDTDNDGLSGREEIFTTGTDAQNSDNEDDGLDDGDKAYAGTNRLHADCDDDGRKDSDEIDNLTDSNSDDTDNDGMINGEEFINGTHALAADTDEDGLDDGNEDDRGTDPRVVDTDGEEVAYGSTRSPQVSMETLPGKRLGNR